MSDKNNPRYQNGNLRRKHRARLKAIGGPCAICGGRLGPIHYDEPSDSKHPLSFVVDEIIPISKATRYGYKSPADAANDWTNLQAAHYCCNSIKSNRVGFSLTGSPCAGGSDEKISQKINVIDGDW